MYLARVFGNVVASHKYETMKGYKLLYIQPVDSNMNDIGNPLIATDRIGAGTDEIILYITSREASIGVDVEPMPSDASIIGIVDRVTKNGEE